METRKKQIELLIKLRESALEQLDTMEKSVIEKNKKIAALESQWEHINESQLFSTIGDQSAEDFFAFQIEYEKKNLSSLLKDKEDHNEKYNKQIEMIDASIQKLSLEAN
ncbi:anaerobic ribonucleoside-triphosphate reductase [Bacillus tianshenii]|uniref:Anaerobic ribonucleoside-triphosphate reductase n=1 Tax=Sutcliffiella tianshenii TaxID=1463404 RepID=A0ABS2NZV5_9BACI|nr:hypothetical protein [Bacillus tianshenii]MBM7620182.1 anaerobic ribonucleoside-triphosphate reductase [Bacillus tianshenii]